MRPSWRPCTRRRRRRTIPFVDLLPPQGLELTPRHYAYLKISEGCNNRCSFCIIPKLRGDLVWRPAADVMREAEKLGQGGRQGAARHHRRIPAPTASTSNARPKALAGRPRRARPSSSISPARSASSASGCACTTSTPTRSRRGHPADGRGQDPALSRHPLPARLAAGAEGHAPPGPPGQGAGAHPWLARDLPGPRASARPSSSASPARREEDFELLLDWLDEAQLDRVGCFKYEPVQGRRRQRPRPRRRCRTRSRKQR